MQLFVGLGNPGDRYAGNRHNIGFMAVDAIAERHRFGPWKRKFQALAADGEIDGVRVLLLKPETYMNESGRAVGEACRFLKIGPASVVALHDELDLKTGEVRIKSDGGNAGHNGLRSMTAHIGNDYRRLRLGIGHPGAKELVSGYVLSDFAKADRDWLEPLLAAIADEAALLAAGEDARFAAAVVKRLAPAKPGAPAKAKGAGGPPSQAAASEEAAPAAGRFAKAPGGGRTAHPAGERAGKRQAALADNLRKWLAANKKDG